MPFIIYTKRCFKSLLFIVVLLIMPVIALCYNAIDNNISKKAEIGIYYNCNYRLGNMKSDIMDFVEYTDLKKMKDDIGLGIIDCGYVFDIKFDNAMSKLEFKNSIDYIVSKSSALQPVANEFIFEKILESCSDKIAQKFFDNKNIDVNTSLYYEKFLKSDSVFNISFENVNSENISDKSFKITYIFALFALAGSLLSSINIIEDRKKGIRKYGFLYAFCYGIWLMISLLISAFICGELTIAAIPIYILYTFVISLFAYIISFVNNKEVVCGIIPVIILIGSAIILYLQF